MWNLGEISSQPSTDCIKTTDVPEKGESTDENIILNHIGHIGTVSEFEWNFGLPWTVISASDDSETFV